MHRHRLRGRSFGSGSELLRMDLSLSTRVAPRSRLVVTATGGLKAKGKRHFARDIAVKRTLGEGSFGQVYEGLMTTPTGQERVVLKRTKAQIPGAQQMSEMEHVLNVYASKVCRNSVAEFMGYCGVSSDEATGNLTQGTWLMWKFQGDKTLATYMRRRDTLAALAEDLDVAEGEVPRTVLKQILLNLKGLHSAGLVHRDVKPSNLVFSVEDKAFKFIDLGACADLRLGTNYVPNESILDAIYCPPEQYVLPTNAPQLSASAFSMVISPMLWSKHKPDRFDVYSAGLIFFQLAVPTMCSDRAIKSFVSNFERHEHDLQHWRQSATLLSRHTQILDANDGAGWDLLQRMLRPRRIEQSSDGTVSFVESEDESLLRVSVDAALAHDFFKTAETREQKPMLNLWRRYSRKLFDLEGKILNQVVETEQQTTTVKKLQSQVSQGEASEQELRKEERKLSSLQASLKSMQNEFVSLSKTAFEKFGVKKQVNQDTVADEILESVDETEDETKAPAEKTETPRSPFGWLRGRGSKERGGTSTSPAEIPGRPENLVYMGLKFTGLAARVAGDLATSIKKDAEKLMEEIETENDKKRHRESTDRRFLEMLKSSRVTQAMAYDDVEKQFRREDSFTAVEPERRQLLFAAYIRALIEKQSKLESKAEEQLRSLFVQRGLHSGSRWEDIAASLGQEKAFLAVKDGERRRQIFESVRKEQHQRDTDEASLEKATSDFRILLRETQPAIRGCSSWPHIKRQIYDDRRYQALPENQRRELFLEYQAIVREIEAEEETERLKALESLKTKAADETAAAEARLTELLQQRANLKEQYAKMQTNLERMEKTLDAHKARIEEKEQRIQHSDDGSVLFRFGDADGTTGQTDPSPSLDPAAAQSDSFARMNGSDGSPV